jgi:UDP-2-acetamido-2,6-beta-L-arabino-hexul-4-ose reductase
MIMNVLITGSNGFIGKNLRVALSRRTDLTVLPFDIKDDLALLREYLSRADVVFHLAGVNRPERIEDFAEVNAGLTVRMCQILEEINRRPLMVLASSTQAELDNPYGLSKKLAEGTLTTLSKRTGTRVRIFRLPGVFGKWSRPNYNTVVATFCYNIARGLPIIVSDPADEVSLVYIDDVVKAFISEIREIGSESGHLRTEINEKNHEYRGVQPIYRITLGDLADRIRQLRDIRQTLLIPDMADPFDRCLQATFLSFLPENDISSPLTINRDQRGWLFELIKSRHFGQIFVSKTLPGVTRGNHYHDSKIEKFCVIKGEGVVRLRRIDSDQVYDYPASDQEIKIVDIPPGYTHSIENTGSQEMICLFWANEIFDPDSPDTNFCEVGK